MAEASVISRRSAEVHMRRLLSEVVGYVERPIIFSAPMVRAILAGTKTQTRRVVKFKPWHQIEDRDDGSPWPWMYDSDRDADHWIPCPYGQPGDRLWVRETWKVDMNHRHYRADEDVPGDLGSSMRWIPSIHMPRWASRITLEIAAVRVERLNLISDADLRAEGGVLTNPSTLRLWYSELWESINGPDSWAANPWVWVVEFKRVGAGA